MNKKILFLLINCICFNISIAEQLMYKCIGDKSYVYYKNINNKGNYNGWYEVSNYKCNQEKSYLNTICDQGLMYITDDNGNKTINSISGINCGDFNLSYPQSNII